MNIQTRVQNLHNKTKDVPDGELPYNPHNVLLKEEDLRKLFDLHGLENVPFSNINLYRNAFVHKSYCTMKNDDFVSGNERLPPNCLPLQEMSYERLEFLGDAILDMVVARYLYERYPDQQEGFLSGMRTKLVNGKMLGYLAGKIGFSSFMIISKQVEDNSGRDYYKILEDMFESFIAAIYLDFQDQEKHKVNISINSMPFMGESGPGFYMAERFIVSVLETYIDFSSLIMTKNNFKDQLVRYMQRAMSDGPRFVESRIDRNQQGQVMFYRSVKDGKGTVLGTGSGATTKDAENAAARNALLYYGITPEE